MTRAHDESVPSDDRGFLYGDGLFETLLTYRGKLFWPELHFERLATGLERLSMATNIKQLRGDVERALTSTSTGYSVARLTVTRRGGERGYAPPVGGDTRWRLHQQNLEVDPLAPGSPLQLGYSRIPLSRQPHLAGIKHCNRLEQVLAAQEARARDVDDVLLLTEEGVVHSSSRGNLFACVEGELFTAPCDSQGIAGTRRRLILEQLADLAGLKVRVEGLQADALQRADAVFLCNSVIGIRAVASIDGVLLRHTDAGQAALSTLQTQYRELSLQCVA